MKNVQLRINDLLAEWYEFIRYFRQAIHKARRTEAAYKHERAKFIVKAKAEQPGLSQSAAEALADADDELYKLYVARLGDDAEVESCKAQLHWFRANSDALRSEKVDERRADELYRDHSSGS